MKSKAEYIKQWYPDSDEEDFFNDVRIRSRWDERRFQMMMATAHAFLNDIEPEEVKSGRWDYAFGEQLAMLIRDLENPAFLTENALHISKEEYRQFIQGKTNELRQLITRYKLIRSSR